MTQTIIPLITSVNQSIDSVCRVSLEIVRHIAPPQRVIHVGAGQGQGTMSYWQNWNISDAWIIDADISRLPSSERSETWQKIEATLSDSEQETEFYQYNNFAEDGLLSLESLVTFWPRLRLMNQSKIKPQRLDALLSLKSEQSLWVEGTWLFIDCLPALTILRGAEKTLQHVQVLFLRVLLNHDSSNFENASLAAIEAHLKKYDYQCVQLIESNNPNLGEALFIRNEANRIRQLLQIQVDEIHQLLKKQSEVIKEREHESQKLKKDIIEEQQRFQIIQAELTQVRDAQAQLIHEHQAQIEKLNKEQSVLKTHIQQLDIEKSALTTTLEQAQKVSSERELVLKTECDQAKKISAELNLKLVTAEQKNQQLAQELTAVQKSFQEAQAELRQVRDAQAQLIHEHQVQIEKLNKEHSELQTQIQQLDIEKSTLAATLEHTQKASSDRELVLTTECDQTKKVSAELNLTLAAAEQKNQQLAQELTAAQTSFQEVQAELTQVRDAQKKLIHEHQAQIEKLNKEYSELQTHIQQLNVEKTSLATNLEKTQKASLDCEATLAAERDQAQKSAIDLKDKLNIAEQKNHHLVQEINELQQRQQLFQEEMVKAEAQIELIKDLLLRDQDNAI